MTTRLNVSVPDEMAKWLEEEPQLKPSGLLQKAIQKEMRKQVTAKEHGIFLKSSPDANVEIVSNIMCACGYVFGIDKDEEKPKCPRCGQVIDLSEVKG